MSDPKNKRWREDSKGSEVSGGPVRRDFHVIENYKGSGNTHTTESITTSRDSTRMSWDTDKDGNNSNFHSSSNTGSWDSDKN